MYILARCFLSAGLFLVMYIMMLSRLATTVKNPIMSQPSDQLRKPKEQSHNNDNAYNPPTTFLATSTSTTTTTTKNKKKKNKKKKKHRKDDPRCQVQYKNGRPYLEADDDLYDEGVGQGDKFRIGPCVYVYPERYPPSAGWLKDVDWFQDRNETSGMQLENDDSEDDTSMPTALDREDCLLQCVQELAAAAAKDNDDDIALYDGMLLASASMGLERVTEFLVKQGLNPKFTPKPYTKKYRLNAFQAAIRGGYAAVLKVLTSSDKKNGLDVVIDEWHRTVRDYISMKGSPIRPYQVLKLWNITIDHDDGVGTTIPTTTEEYGWDTRSSSKEVDNTCHFDVIEGDLTHDEFFKNYYVTGRPFVLANHALPDEMESFSRTSWARTRHFHPNRTHHKVGPTAYPGLTGQEYCSIKMTPQEILENKICPSAPSLKMIHAEHDDYFDQAYKRYDGDPYRAGFRKLPQWFGHNHQEPAWQIFFGGDGSGATLHWHAAALNILYVGTKEWRITPPAHRGFTGMTVQQVTQQIREEPFVLKCTQRPGDLFYIPDFWGHMTVNHGFGIGVAAIVSTNRRVYMGSFVVE